MATDPICRMTVDEETGPHTDYNEQTYYFCSQHCLAKFKEDPEKFLKSPAATRATQGDQHAHTHGVTQAPDKDKPEQGVYVCPMDPEVRESRPGACPKCGMALGAGSARRLLW